MKIMVLATPKTGNHWLKFLLSTVYGLPVLASHDEASRFPNWVDHEHMMPNAATVEWLTSEGILPVTIVRHPADVLVSLYHYIKMKEDVPWEETTVLRDSDGIGAGTLEFAQSHFYPLLLISDLWQSAGAPLVRYEDLLGDPMGALRNVTTAISPVSDNALRRAIVCCDFSTMRDEHKTVNGLKSDHNFFRRGSSGYSDELPEAFDVLLSSEPFADYMKRFGYEMPVKPIKKFDVRNLDPFKGNRAFSNGVRISNPLYRLFMRIPDLERWARPWEVSAATSFYDWLNAPVATGARITNLMAEIRSQRLDLQEAYPDLSTSTREFTLWFLSQASREYEFGAEFLLPPRRLLMDGAVAEATAV